MDAAARMRIRAPHLDACQAHGELCPAMETIPEGDKLIPSRVDGCQQQGTFIGLRAGGAEECLLQIPRCHLCQLFRQIDKILREINIAHMLQALHLLHHPGINLRVAVAAVDNRHAGKAVQVLPALAIVKVLHLPLDKLPRLFVKMCQARHDIFLFLFQNGLRAYRLLQWHKTTLPYLYPK